MSNNSDFAENLRFLCANQGPISEVCRDIGINRQQFNRYINGTGKPAAHTLRKISVYFGVPETEFFAAAESFELKYATTSRVLSNTPMDILNGAFADQEKQMLNYIGIYHTYVVSPSWEGKILCSLTQLSLQQGYTVVRTVQPEIEKDDNFSRRTKFNGLATYRGNRIYVVEVEEGNDTSLVETVLYPTHRQQVVFLHGITLGVASQPRLTPYSSKTIWQRVPERDTARVALQSCGVFDFESRQVPQTIREHLFS